MSQQTELVFSKCTTEQAYLLNMIPLYPPQVSEPQKLQENQTVPEQINKMNIENQPCFSYNELFQY